MKNHIEIQHVSFSYPDGTEVFKEIDLMIAEGETAGIIGPNGAGKTTLLLAIAGLIDFSGEIEVSGKSVNKKNIADIRSGISFVFQNPDDQLFMPTVEEDISFGLEKLGFNNDEIKNRVSSSLQRVDLAGFEKKSSHHLSLGQKKRICLAAAFARDSKLLLLDEPSNELDPKGRREFMELIDSMKCTKLIVSHDLNLIYEMCDKVAVLNDKKIIAYGDKLKILSNKKLMIENSLEVPLLLKIQILS